MEYIEGAENITQDIKNVMEETSYKDLERFLDDHVNDYHPNGHMAVSNGTYRHVQSGPL